MEDVSEKIGLIELCFSGHHQEKPYQQIETKMLNNLFYTIKEQKKLIESLMYSDKMRKGK